MRRVASRSTDIHQRQGSIELERQRRPADVSARPFGRLQSFRAGDPGAWIVAFALVRAGRLRATAFVAKRSSGGGARDDSFWADPSVSRGHPRLSL